MLLIMGAIFFRSHSLKNELSYIQKGNFAAYHNKTLEKFKIENLEKNMYGISIKPSSKKLMNFILILWNREICWCVSFCHFQARLVQKKISQLQLNRFRSNISKKIIFLMNDASFLVSEAFGTISNLFCEHSTFLTPELHGKVQIKQQVLKPLP